MAKERKNRASFKYQKIRGNGPKRTETPATHAYGWTYATDPRTWKRETLDQPGILYGGLTAATRAVCNKLLKAELLPVKIYCDMFASANDIPAEMKELFVKHAAASGTALQQDLTAAFTLSEAHFRDVPDEVEEGEDEEDETDEEVALALKRKIDALPPNEKATVMQEMKAEVAKRKQQQ